VLQAERQDTNHDVWRLRLVTGRGLPTVVGGNMFYYHGFSVARWLRHQIAGAGRVCQHVQNDVSCAVYERGIHIYIIRVVLSALHSVVVYANVHVVMI